MPAQNVVVNTAGVTKRPAVKRQRTNSEGASKPTVVDITDDDNNSTTERKRKLSNTPLALPAPPSSNAIVPYQAPSIKSEPVFSLPPANATLHAKKLWKTTTALGRENIAKLFAENSEGWRGESCGRSGYRLLYSDGRTGVQLRGSANYLGKIAYPAEQTSGANHKHGSSSGVRFDDDGPSYFGSDAGRRRGMDIHTELCDFVNMIPEKFEKLHDAVDPITRATLERISTHGITLIQGERIVAHIPTRAGTALDGIGLNKRGGIDLFEYKTGYAASNFTEVTPQTLSMLGPFKDLKDTPFNRAQLQLLYGAWLFEECTGIVPDTLWVVHGTPDTDQAILHRIEGRMLSFKSIIKSEITHHAQNERLLKEQKRQQKKLLKQTNQ